MWGSLFETSFNISQEIRGVLYPSMIAIYIKVLTIKTFLHERN